MKNVVPPFKVDITGAFLKPETLKEVREGVLNGQLNQAVLRNIEDVEIKKLVNQLKTLGAKVVTDGGFRNHSWPYDFMNRFEGVRMLKGSNSRIELYSRLGLHHHSITDDFAFLVKIAGPDLVPKQVLPAPSTLLTELLQSESREKLDSIYPNLEVLIEDIAISYHKLVNSLYNVGCRYIQFDDTTHVVNDNAIRVNNMSLSNYPSDLYVSFYACNEMLYAVKGANSLLLDYNFTGCDKKRLLWFVREKQVVFGFVLSHYPVESDLDELCAKISEVNRYIPLHRFTLCIPNPKFSSSESFEVVMQKQWDTLKIAKKMCKRLWPDE